MRLAYLLIVALCVVLTLAFPSAATNVLANPNFEPAGIGLRGWTVTNGSTVYAVVPDDSGRGGNCIEGIEPEPGGSLGRLLQKIDAKVLPGGTYRLRGWIKTTDVRSDGGVVIGVGTVNDEGMLIAGSFQREIGRVKGTTDWTFYDSGDFVIPELTPGTVSHAVYLDFNGQGGGRALFDDITLDGGDSIWLAFKRGGVGVGALCLAAIVSIFVAVYSTVWIFRKMETRDRS